MTSTDTPDTATLSGADDELAAALALEQPAAPADEYDPLAALTANELAIGSRHLKASLVAAITQTTADYEQALAVVLWLHRRRTERGAQLADVMGLTFQQITDELGALEAEQGPTVPTPSP